MDREKPPLNPVLKDLANRERRNLGPHLAPEELAAYHDAELSGEDEDRVRDHLALCPECSALYLDLADFASPEPERDVSGLTDEQVDAAWQAMRARLAGTPAAEEKPPEAPEVRAPRAVPEPVPEPPPEPRLETPAATATMAAPAPPDAGGTVVPLQRPERARPSRVYQSLAAMFLLTTLGAGFWGLSLQRQFQELQKPQVVTAKLPLEPGGSSTRSAEEKLPSAGTLTKVQLFLDQVPDAPQYQVELRDTNGNLLWAQPSVPAPRDDGPLEVVFSFNPGDYLFRVEGAGKITDFPFTIEP